MAGPLEFTTAAREVEEEDYTDEERYVPVTLDGRKITFERPSTAMLVAISGITGQVSDDEIDSEFVETYMGMFFNLMVEDGDKRHIRNRLLNRKDPFDENSILQIMEGIVAHWSGRPTKRPSDFQESRSATGRSSTARTRAKASTSSASRRAGSST